MVRGLSWWTTNLNLKMLFAALCVPTHPQYTCPYSYLARWKKNTGLAIICSSFKELFAGLTVQVVENYTSHIWQSFSSVGRACEEESQLIWFFLWVFLADSVAECYFMFCLFGFSYRILYFLFSGDMWFMLLKEGSPLCYSCWGLVHISPIRGFDLADFLWPRGNLELWFVMLACANNIEASSKC